MSYPIMFYNLENLYDTIDDPRTNDEEFTPTGAKRWTPERYNKKLENLSQVFSAVASAYGGFPVAVGMSEVENLKVLKDLAEQKRMRGAHYKAVHFESNDARGVDVGFFYRPDKFTLMGCEPVKLVLRSGREYIGRDILAAWGSIEGEMFIFYVCHFLSRRAGVNASQGFRRAGAETVRDHAEAMRGQYPDIKVVIMGDMNDTPSSKAKGAWWGSQFVNLMLPLQRDLRTHPSAFGSHKYHGQWGYLDQFIINREHAPSGVLESTTANRSEEAATAKGDTLRSLVFSAPRSFHLPFMLTDDVTHLGHRPARSYMGYQYEGGYSDHLPILLDLDICF